MGKVEPALAVIGGGAMAQAILGGAAQSGVLAGPLCVADPNETCRERFEISVSTAREAVEWLTEHEGERGSGQIMLAVKPQMLPAVGDEIADLVGDRVVISILAGAGGKLIRSTLGGNCRVVRVMPNTPAQIMRGMTAIAASVGASEADTKFAQALFESVGSVIRIDESMMDAFTAVAGSGPAYVFYLAEAMARGALDVGFDEQTAARIVTETVSGAAELLRQDPASAPELRQRVTSKKGTTQAATDSFDASGVMDAIAKGVVAARDRGIELGQG
ncbi:MAG: pyrroline-5-carboxylate reductase [Phycisphaerales bacterium]